MDREVLSDARGPVLDFLRGERAGTPRADVAVLVHGRTVADAVSCVTEQLPGWRLTTEDTLLTQALIEAGATLQRHAFIMSCPLGDEGSALQLPAEFAVQELPATADVDSWQPVLRSWRAAFPPGHPDYIDMSADADAVQFFANLIDGSEMGPLHRSSCLLINADGQAVAGIIVNVRAGDPPSGGPWISDIWRDPVLRGTGVGPALIDRAKRMLHSDGYTALTLAVTASNDAHRSYERTGFVVVMDSRILKIPT